MHCSSVAAALQSASRMRAGDRVAGFGLALLLILSIFSTMAHAELRVLEPRHADPESLLPVVQALLGPGESVSVFGNALVVNAGAGTQHRIDELLGQLDRPQRNLLISVRRGGSAVQHAQGAGVEGTLQRGNVRIGPGGNTPAGSTVQIRGGRQITTQSGSGESSVRTLEGRPVLIRDGALVPLAGNGYWGTGVQYEDVSQGFVVRARLAGDQVRLDIEARNDRLEGGTVRTGALASSVSGRLGEWIPLGGSTAGSESTRSGLTTRHSTRGRADELVEVRVETIDAP